MNRMGLKKKMAIVFAVLLLVVIFLSGTLAVNRGIALTKAILGNLAYKAAFTAAQLVDGDKLKAIVDTMDESNPYYAALQAKLNSVRETLNLRYLYTMTKTGNGQFIYLVDGLDASNEDFSTLGDVEADTNFYPNFEIAMQGQIVKDDFEFSDEWGDLVSAYIPIKDSSGTVIAFLGADFEASDILVIMNRNTVMMLLFTTVISVLGIAAALLISFRLAAPLLRLRDYSLKTAEGGFAQPELSPTSDEVGDLAAVLESRMDAVRNLLDHVGQGFLTFGEDLRIHSEYSLECTHIFQQEIENANFLELVYPKDSERQKFLSTIFVKILREKDRSRREVYLPLLADEVVLNDRYINIEYKVISSEGRGQEEQFMAVLTDMTEKRLLESQIETERDTLKMVVKVVVNHTDFADCIRDYQSFYQRRLGELLNSGEPIEEILYEVFRNIHTFKGNFSQLDMQHIAEKLHVFEDQLSDIRSRLDQLSLADVKALFGHIDLESWIEQDLLILRGILGERFLMRFAGMDSVLLINKSKIEEIEEKMVAVLSPFDCKLLLPELQQLRYKPFKDLLRSYPEYITKMAERLGKQVKYTEIQGGDFLVDAENYNSLSRALVHIFRNAVDHGIEFSQERVMKNKEEIGRIRCKIEKDEKNIRIVISDDGRGIDTKKIRNKAVQKGILDDKTALTLSHDELLRLVFTDGFTTREDTSAFSGRGIGLSAVIQEVEKLRGCVEVKTKAGAGTEFRITLPYHDIAEILNLKITDIMNPLMDTAQRVICEELGDNTAIYSGYHVDLTEKIQLHRFTAFIDIKGVLEGRFIMSLDEKLAKSFTRQFIIGDFPAEQESDFVEDAVAECLNIVLGNSLKMFPGIEDYIIFTTPVTANAKDTVIKYPGADIWTCSLNFATGKMSLSFATTYKEL